MYDHLILVSKEHMIGSEITNLIYTEVRVRASKHHCSFIQNEDYEPLVERELNDKQIENFKDNMHLYTKVQENEHGTIYQHGKDFKKMYWSLFPKVEEAPKKVFVDKKHPERTHKVCKICKLSLPFSEFYVTSNNYLVPECKKCKKEMYNNNKKPERTHKICSKCKLKLPSSEFYVRSNNQLYEECKECKKKRRNNKKKSVSLQKTI